jgi:sarcosine oxidase subunit beta
VKIAVVGAGITGLSIAFHLAEKAAQVVVYERTGVGAEASGVQPGGVRQQWSTAVNCLLARESVAFYREVSARLEPRTSPVLEACGYLFLAHSPERREALARDVALQNEMGVRSALLEPEDLPYLLAGIDVSEVTGASYCAEDGYFTRLSRNGAGWSLERHAADTVHADAVVVATGYDAPTLVGTLGVDLPIGKEPRYLLLSEPIAERLLEPLVVSAEWRFAAKHLGSGRVLASDLAADGNPAVNAATWRARVKENARRLVPVLEYVTYPIVVEGFYDVTPDHQPLIAPVENGVWVAAGFSGHGFMIAPAVGRMVAEALLTAGRDPALDSFALDRFERGTLAPELQIV